MPKRLAWRSLRDTPRGGIDQHGFDGTGIGGPHHVFHSTGQLMYACGLIRGRTENSALTSGQAHIGIGISPTNAKFDIGEDGLPDKWPTSIPQSIGTGSCSGPSQQVPMQPAWPNQRTPPEGMRPVRRRERKRPWEWGNRSSRVRCRESPCPTYTPTTRGPPWAARCQAIEGHDLRIRRSRPG